MLITVLSAHATPTQRIHRALALFGETTSATIWTLLQPKVLLSIVSLVIWLVIQRLNGHRPPALILAVPAVVPHGCCLPSSVHCRVTNHNLPLQIDVSATSASPMTKSPRFAGPYGKMVAPDVGKKLALQDFTASPSTRSKKEVYRLEASCMIKVKWWFSDTDRPHFFSVPVPSFPWFHPMDCPLITQKVGLPCLFFDLLPVSTQSLESSSPEDDEWVSTAVAVRVKPDDILYMRSPNVTVCSGLRRPQRNKRPLSPESRPISQSNILDSPSPLKRKKMSESDVIEISDTSDNEDRVEPLKYESPRHVKLPLIFHSSDPFVSHAGPSTLIIVQAAPSVNVFNLTDAPPGRRAKWLLLYAVDMVNGLTQLEAMHGRREDNFSTVFSGSKWNSSTYSDSSKAWRKTAPAVLAAAVQCGRASGGEWAPLLKATRKSAP
ncbi:hypothetical protein C8J57DRAFT_1539076 [Mycena rebaudengoi]|nr:hypothetical protein C8J57DRAFT_1539076 [Mycena rebaudengoi]